MDTSESSDGGSQTLLLTTSGRLHQSEKILLSESSEGLLGQYVRTAQKHMMAAAKVQLAVAKTSGASSHAKKDEDEDLHTYLNDLHAKAKEGKNYWYKVERKIAMMIVNIAGKFEADLRSSDPVYVARMGGFGLPRFYYELDFESLGKIVENFVKGPFYNNEKTCDGPQTAAKVKGDESIARKDRYEKEELEYEKEKGFVRLNVEADFSNWGILSMVRDGLSPEEARLHNAQVVTTILNHVSNIGHSYGLRFVFNHMTIMHTQASMRCAFNGENWKGQMISREREVEILNLIGSNTSSKSLQNLNSAVRLKYLYLDGCPLASFSSKSGRTKANVFDELTQHGPVAELVCLSIVGTSAMLSSDWLSKVEAKCPKLALVYFTRRPGDKALGWSDVVMMQSMREPCILPCGHVGDASSLRNIRNHLCPICRTEFKLDSLIVLKASITQLTRVKDTWKATIVDCFRFPLDDKVLYHDCGEFYNFRSIKTLYPVAQNEINQELVGSLANEVCLRCAKPFGGLCVCYPRSAVEDDVEFNSLQEACGYFTADKH